MEKGKRSNNIEQTALVTAMSVSELEAIGERLYGHWGWQTQLARRLKVDGSTVRRWKAGAPISEAMATAIRGIEIPNATQNRKSAHSNIFRRVLLLISGIQGMTGGREKVSVINGPTGLLVSVRMPDGSMTHLWESDGWNGIGDVERAYGL